MDHSTDTNKRLLFQINENYNLPGYVSTALQKRAFTEKEYSRLRADSFADKSGRMYPIHTKEDTFLSCAYINKTAATLKPSVDARLNDACTMWGIDRESILPNSIQKQAATEDQIVEFAYEGSVLGRVPVLNKQAATDVINHLLKPNYPLSTRKDTVAQIVKIASTLEAPIDSSTQNYLNKLACTGFCDLPTILTEIGTRDRILIKQASTKYKAVFQQLREVCEKNSAGNPGGLVDSDTIYKVASMLDITDRAKGLTRAYGSKLKDPVELFKYTPEFIREEGAKIQKVAGRSFRIATINYPKTIDFFSNVFNKHASIDTFDKDVKDLTDADQGKLADFMDRVKIEGATTVKEEMTSAISRDFGTDDVTTDDKGSED